MRIYQNFPEALGEIKRDLAEMGIRVHSSTYQDRFIGDKPEFETMELQNYIYVVTSPRPDELHPTQPWADAEFLERVNPKLTNPGEAWKTRPEVWTEFLRDDGTFSYTYSERMYFQLGEIREVLADDPNSRQAFLAIWNPQIDPGRIGGWQRVPCSLGYQFQIRNDKLNMTYLQRSSDFATHFENDVYLAHCLQCYMAESLQVPVGNYTHWIGSLHIFQKDIAGVF